MGEKREGEEGGHCFVYSHYLFILNGVGKGRRGRQREKGIFFDWGLPSRREAAADHPRRRGEKSPKSLRLPDDHDLISATKGEGA